ncbi:major capsid protein [Actinobacillus porcinus]|uniref:major capsid protein n=1 Tax=Actinobacillus porcinus TaxID=51048 RepID=UPI002353EC71|nr:major capsid protein [Actinobacillus porcinus]MDD7545580.1 major capsid protein [Actinobacillus porcinus]MDY5847627.1 major capsid protein [Actinobacillus porcinus]
MTTKIADVIVPEVFAPYVINRTTEKSALWQSGIISNIDEATLLAQKGGALINMPFWQDLTGESEVLSDSTPLSVNKIQAKSDVAILHARGKAWGANDLARALSGDDPLGAISELAATYWAREMQKITLSTLKGIFGAATMAGNLADISAQSGANAVIGGDKFIDASFKLGDEVDQLSAVAMHSATAAVLAKQGLIETIRDADGVILYQTYMDKRIIVDDGMPVESGVYTTYLFGAGALGYGEVTPPVPVETDRDTLQGTDILINRRHFILHPRGVKWKGAAGIAPNNAGLATQSNWERVYDPKQIRIVAFKHKLA